MNLPIRGRYEESAELMADAAKQVPSPRWVIWFYVFAAFASVAMAYMNYVAKQQGWFVFLFFFPIFCLVMFLMNSKWSLRRKYFAATGRRSTIVTIEFHEDGFRTQTDSGIKMGIPWSAVDKCIEKDAGILFYSPGNQIRWIPKNAFDSQSDFAGVVALAKTSVPNFKSLQT
jgi:hypothetical protein